jgi:hypothetical protein
MSMTTLEKALGLPARRISRYISVPSLDPASELFEVTIKRLSDGDMTEIERKVAALPNVWEAVKTSD